MLVECPLLWCIQCLGHLSTIGNVIFKKLVEINDVWKTLMGRPEIQTSDIFALTTNSQKHTLLFPSSFSCHFLIPCQEVVSKLLNSQTPIPAIKTFRVLCVTRYFFQWEILLKKINTTDNASSRISEQTTDL